MIGPTPHPLLAEPVEPLAAQLQQRVAPIAIAGDVLRRGRAVAAEQFHEHQRLVDAGV